MIRFIGAFARGTITAMCAVIGAGNRCAVRLFRFDADQRWCFHDGVQRGDACQGVAHRTLLRLVGDQNDGNRLAG